MTNYTSTLSPDYNVISIFGQNLYEPIPFANNKPPPNMAYPEPYKPLLNNNQTGDEIHNPAVVAVPYRIPEL